VSRGINSDKSFVSRARIFKLLRSPRIEGINTASIYSLAGQHDKPIPTWFLAPKDCLKIPAQESRNLKKKFKNSIESWMYWKAICFSLSLKDLKEALEKS
jgi:hypothetical protein